MTGRIPARVARVAASLLAVTAVSAVAVASAGAATVQYSNLPSPLPGNVPSVGFEATSAAELGGQVQFAGTVTNPTVSVGMSSWSCQSGGAEDGSCVSAPGSTYNWPITLNVYEVGPSNTVGAKIVTLTQTFAIPYRPSADKVHCVGNGGWYRAKSCFHGKLFKITFSKLGSHKAPLTLPAKAIVSVAYNTTDHGYAPTGTPGPEDSLNVGIGGLASVGSDPLTESLYWNTTYGPFYCDGGAGGTGTFRVDSGCWVGEQPLIQVKGQ
jgi:hypothetical protein